jgi:hypothetical protein
LRGLGYKWCGEYASRAAGEVTRLLIVSRYSRLHNSRNHMESGAFNRRRHAVVLICNGSGLAISEALDGTAEKHPLCRVSEVLNGSLTRAARREVSRDGDGPVKGTCETPDA